MHKIHDLSCLFWLVFVHFTRKIMLLTMNEIPCKLNIVMKEVEKLLVYKIDVLETLKEAGYNTTKLRKEKLLNESAIQYLREGKPVGAKALNNICKLLEMQPGNILKFVENENTENNVK